MTNEELAKGMVVWLKTGSPSMTVKFKTTKGEWLCSWFVGMDVKEHSFIAEQLTTEDPIPQLPIMGGSSRESDNRY